MIKKAKKQEADKTKLYAKVQPGTEFSGKVPNLLIGTYGYPQVRIGTLAGEADSPSELVKKKLNIKEIVEQRQAILNTNIKSHVKEQHKYLEETQTIAKSTNAVDTHIEIDKPLRVDTQFHEKAMPHGPSAQLKHLELNEEPRIKRSVERLTNDTDAKAATVMSELQTKGINEYHMTKLLSAGTLGTQEKRKIVPTKWSITAVDDTYAKQLRTSIQDHDDHQYSVFQGYYLGNYFFICIQPGDFSYELIEVVLPGSIYNQTKELFISKDHEFTQGRKNYVNQTAGGYYAAKLPVLEYFKKIKKQGRVTEFRIITPQYDTPLGVWVVREGVRITLQANQQSGKGKQEGFTREEFSSLSEIKKKLTQELKQFHKKTQEIIAESVLFKTEQKGLRSFF